MQFSDEEVKAVAEAINKALYNSCNVAVDFGRLCTALRTDGKRIGRLPTLEEAPVLAIGDTDGMPVPELLNTFSATDALIYEFF